MNLPRTLLATAVLLPLPAIWGCASAGPDLHGPEGPSLMAAYSGDWILVPTESDDLNARIENSMREGPSGQRSGRMGGGRPGGSGGGGRRGGSGGGGMMPGGVMDPEAMRESMAAIRQMGRVPGRISLTLQPETVTVTQDAAAVILLGLGAPEEEMVQGRIRILGTAEWKSSGIEIKRELENGVGVTDKFSLDEGGNLILNREINLMGRSVKGRLLYQRPA